MNEKKRFEDILNKMESNKRYELLKQLEKEDTFNCNMGQGNDNILEGIVNIILDATACILGVLGIVDNK